MFLVFTSPRGRRRGSVALPVGREAGIEELMKGGAEREVFVAEAAPALSDSDSIFGGDVVISASEDVGGCVYAVDEI